jgi:membrane protein implicated in regulation of membrane protease activity
MNWKKGGLWIIIFFIVKGTLSTLLIVTGAKYFNLSYMQIFVIVLVLLLISLTGRKILQRRKQKQKDLNM